MPVLVIAYALRFVFSREKHDHLDDFAKCEGGGNSRFQIRRKDNIRDIEQEVQVLK